MLCILRFKPPNGLAAASGCSRGNNCKRVRGCVCVQNVMQNSVESLVNVLESYRGRDKVVSVFIYINDYLRVLLYTHL